MIVERNVPHFSTPFHFHPECELVYVLEGRGKRIVGDSVEFFDKGDLVFLGSNIPHVWYSDEAYYQKKPQLRSKAIVVYFNKDIFGPNFYLLNETQALKQLFHKAERGMKITGSYTQLLDLIRKLPSIDGLERITSLLQMLQFLSQTKEYDLLASIGYQNTYDTKDNHKIDDVFQFVSQNFFQDISLEDMARRCHLTPQSFCRFFKKRTQKTFIDFLNEFRVSHARKLLAERDEMTISEIAYECGFHNISNFNKIFKEKTNGTPRQYKKRMQEN